MQKLSAGRLGCQEMEVEPSHNQRKDGPVNKSV